MALSELLLRDIAILWETKCGDEGVVAPWGEAGLIGLRLSSENPSFMEPGQYCSGIPDESLELNRRCLCRDLSDMIPGLSGGERVRV